MSFESDVAKAGRTLLLGKCVQCKGKNQGLLVITQKQPEVWASLFLKKERSSVEVSKKLATNVKKNPARALKSGAETTSASLFKSLKTVLSSVPILLKFPHAGEGLYFEKFV